MLAEWKVVLIGKLAIWKEGGLMCQKKKKERKKTPKMLLNGKGEIISVNHQVKYR